MTKERRLGRGLEALLGRPIDPAPQERFDELRLASEPREEAGGLIPLDVDQIDSNPFQPRRDFDDRELGELAESLRQHGLLQPIVVRRAGRRFQLIAGERRLRAAVKAGWTQIDAQVREADDRELAELAIVENLARKDLNALEKAASFQQYLERYAVTQEELAGRLKIDRSTVANLIRLLELPDAVQQSLRSGRITQGHARALLPLGDEDEQVAFCRRIEEEHLSVRSVEALVQETILAADHDPLNVFSPDAPARPRRPRRSEHLTALEQELRQALGTRVDVRQGSKERGKIVVHFTSHEEFERLRDYLTGHAEPGARSQAG